MSPFVELRDLELDPVLHGVGLTIEEGEAVGVVGSSGSGKTTLALALLGHLRAGIRHTAGTCRINGQDMLPRPHPGVRGELIGYVGQDPGAALNPYARVGSILATTGQVSKKDAPALLRRVGLSEDLAGRYPHQLSGGQQQRVVLAAALAREPKLLVLDEPTTALDLLAKREVVTELVRLRDEGVGLLWISHDLDTVAAAVDRVVVLDQGRVVEDGPVSRALGDPDSPAARQLITAGHRPGPPVVDAPVVLEGQSVSAGYRGRPVLSDVDLVVRAGECVAVLGVSGVGKTTLARRLAGLHHEGGGAVVLEGQALAADVRSRTTAQRGALGLVAQNPAEALHPRQDVRTALSRPLRKLRGITDKAEQDVEIARLLSSVDLPSAVVRRLPAELSGGQRQRVALARALAAKPKVLICDEVTAALDTVTQAGILELLGNLRAGLGLAVVLITHDAKVAATASDQVLVLAGGRVAAAGPTAELLPPEADPERVVTRLLTGEPHVTEPKPTV